MANPTKAWRSLPDSARRRAGCRSGQDLATYISRARGEPDAAIRLTARGRGGGIRLLPEPE